jgi:hypothetical protein
MTERSAPAGKVRPIPALPPGWQSHGYAALRDGNLAILAVDTDMRTALRWDDKLGFPGDPFELAKKTTARIWTFDGVSLETGPSFSLLQPGLGFDQFPDRRWLIVAKRAQGEPNARILSPVGDKQTSIFLGDGIEHVKIDDTNRIWVGWFDEGIFGNRTWQVAGLEWPPSSYGLACFDDRGSLLEHAGAGPSAAGIADTYALNVFGKNAWACTYTEFPIVRMGTHSEFWWQTFLRGPRALAIRDHLVLAVGGYETDRNLAVLLRLSDDSATDLGRWRLPFKPGAFREPPGFDFMDGRGEMLHLVQNGNWHRWRVADFMPA